MHVPIAGEEQIVDRLMETKFQLQTGRNAMKVMHRVALMVASVAVLGISMPVHASQMDDRIDSSARNSYVFKTYLQSDDIKIQSLNGAVTLTGSVSNEAHKSLASESVANLPGVTSVDNRLEVKGERPAENSDAWLMMKVKTTLLLHRSVNGFTTEVSAVKDGIVTLRGEAASRAQKDLATEYAKAVEGVHEVKNEMTVSGAKTSETVGQDVDDASITAQVKMVLLYHRPASALNTSVTTNKGVVTLGGKVTNAAEKALTTKLVNDVTGVRSVKNLLTIE
jgi:osmotically-inducible protein OsmY